VHRRCKQRVYYLDRRLGTAAYSAAQHTHSNQYPPTHLQSQSLPECGRGVRHARHLTAPKEHSTWRQPDLCVHVLMAGNEPSTLLPAFPPLRGSAAEACHPSGWTAWQPSPDVMCRSGAVFSLHALPPNCRVEVHRASSTLPWSILEADESPGCCWKCRD
jgi:hypothetical protein